MESRNQTVRALALLYVQIQLTLMGRMDEAVPNHITAKQKKILARLLDEFIASHKKLISEEILDGLDLEKGSTAVMDFLHSNHREWALLQDERKRGFRQSPVGELLYQELLQADYLVAEVWDATGEKDVKLNLAGNDAYVRSLLLTGAEMTQKRVQGCLIDMGLSEDETGWSLELELDGPQGEDFVIVAFQAAEVLIEVHDYTDFLFLTTSAGAPWKSLARQLLSLRHKEAALGPGYLNAGEQALLPLASFRPLRQFLPWESAELEEHPEATGVFACYCRENAGGRLLPLLEQYQRSQGRAKRKLVKKMREFLEAGESEALWRALTKDIKAAAEAYPKLRKVHGEELAGRDSISSDLRKLGYTGSYPNFRKLAPLKGVRLVGSMDKNWFVFREKHMASLVTCQKTNDAEGKTAVGFLSSTVFLKEPELSRFEELDGWSGFFKDRKPNQGRLLFPKDAEAGITDLAARTAELDHLGRQDRARLIISAPSPVTDAFLILMVVLLGGLLFGGGMLLVVLVIALVVSLAATGSLVMVGELFQVMPALEIFLMTGLPFGIAMGIFTAIIARRMNL